MRCLWFCVFEASDLRMQRHQHYCMWPQAWHLILWGDQWDGSRKECSRRNFETRAKMVQIHQGAQELWWEIVTLQCNDCVILNIKIISYLIFMIWGPSVLTVLCTAVFHLYFVSNCVLDSKPRYVRINTLALKVHAALKIFCDDGWKQIDYDRKAEDYASFLHRVASLADDEFIQDLHMRELLIFPNKAEFYKNPLYLEGCIILQDKVRLTF